MKPGGAPHPAWGSGAAAVCDKAVRLGHFLVQAGSRAEHWTAPRACAQGPRATSVRARRPAATPTSTAARELPEGSISSTPIRTGSARR